MILYTSILTVDSADFKTGTENKLEQVQKLASSSPSLRLSLFLSLSLSLRFALSHSLGTNPKHAERLFILSRRIRFVVSSLTCACAYQNEKVRAKLFQKGVKTRTLTDFDWSCRLRDFYN